MTPERRLADLIAYAKAVAGIEGQQRPADDLTRFELSLAQAVDLPPVAAALVREPDSTLLSCRSGMRADDHHPRYMPFAANRQQRRISALLEDYPGVVVQGPPGTGKTHSIANIVCDFLARGRRVLVTSSSPTALSVLLDKLPEDFRQLAVGLVSTDASSLRTLEHTASRLIDRLAQTNFEALATAVHQLEIRLDGELARLACIDQQLMKWGGQHLGDVGAGGEILSLKEVAEWAIRHPDAVATIPDELGQADSPQFVESDIARLRTARRELGEALGSIAADDAIVEPWLTGTAISTLHAELCASLPQELQGMVVVASRELAWLSQNLEKLRTLRAALGNSATDHELKNARARFLELARNRRLGSLVGQFGSLALELAQGVAAAGAERQEVFIPAAIQQNPELQQALFRLARGESAFTFWKFDHGEESRVLEDVRINGGHPKNTADWCVAARRVRLDSQLRGLVSRYDAIAGNVGLPLLPTTANYAVVALSIVEALPKIDELAQAENAILGVIRHVMPFVTEPDIESTFHAAEQLVSRLRPVLPALAKFDLLHRQARTVLHPVGDTIRSILNDLGKREVTSSEIADRWQGAWQELDRQQSLAYQAKTVEEITAMVAASGAPRWAEALRIRPVTYAADALLPDHWHDLWEARRLTARLSSSVASTDFRRHMAERAQCQKVVDALRLDLAGKRAWFEQTQRITPKVLSALQAYQAAVARIGKGQGKRARRHQHEAREAGLTMGNAIPCWIMPLDRVADILPAELGHFDLVVIDEASQATFTLALPALLRARQVLVVGDERQVSPEGVGFAEAVVEQLAADHLKQQVPLYRAQMAPERSVYDLARVAFAGSAVQLREHFRSVPAIFAFSRDAFYDGRVAGLRPPQTTNVRPPLVDVLIEDGRREGDLNPSEARYIAAEVSRLATDPSAQGLTVGIVSLLGRRQADYIERLCLKEIGRAAAERMRLTVGDARSFQGRECDVVFLSMVVSPGQATALTRDAFAQRFNVATTRARDHLILVRSIDIDHLSNADTLRRQLIGHFVEVGEPSFELAVSHAAAMAAQLSTLGYRAQPQAGQLATSPNVIVSAKDSGGHLGIFLDGTTPYSQEAWRHSLEGQYALESAGWHIERVSIADWLVHRPRLLDHLQSILSSRGIAAEPCDSAPPSRVARVRVRAAVIFHLSACEPKILARLQPLPDRGSEVAAMA